MVVENYEDWNASVWNVLHPKAFKVETLLLPFTTYVVQIIKASNDLENYKLFDVLYSF